MEFLVRIMRKILEFAGVYNVANMEDETEKDITARVATHTAVIFGPIVVLFYIIIILLV